MQAKIVLGSQFGDEGKGVVTHTFTKNLHYSDPIVVRFSGGQQAGHTVEHKGVRHVFSNFGSGSFMDAPTYLTEHVTFNPQNILREYEVLKSKGVHGARIRINPMARMTTPMDVLYNQITHKIRNHGSCVMGVGATHERHDKSNYHTFAIDLLHLGILKQKLHNVLQYYKERFNLSDLLAMEINIESFIQDCKTLIEFGIVTVRDYDSLFNAEDLIFEGSQGILLDMDHGLFPNVTYSNTTSVNAIEVCSNLDISPEEIGIYYVSRCYQTRHGNGWMSNNTPVSLIHNELETNKDNPEQGVFRIGEFDEELIKYAMEVDYIYSVGIENRNLIITCLDQRPGWMTKFFKFNSIPSDIKIWEYFNHNPSLVRAGY